VQALAGLNLEQKLKDLQETQSKLHHIGKALGKRKTTASDIADLAKSYGVEVDEDQKNQLATKGTRELIAHSIAERVLA
jgi:hypothetical protein